MIDNLPAVDPVSEMSATTSYLKFVFDYPGTWVLTSFQQHVPHKHFGGEITSRAIAGRRCYRTRMYEVTWSNHNLTLFPIKPHISGTGGFTVRALCKLHSSFSNQNTLIKIPACKPVRARRRRPASLTLAFTPLLRTCTGSEAQRSLMCTGVFWEWALRHDAGAERRQ